MSRLLGNTVGKRMEIPEYYADFQLNYDKTTEFWKLERGQNYAEPGNASWEAFDSGNWAEAMRLLEESRGSLVDHFRYYASRGLISRRIRIVSLPPSDYLHWELYVLNLRDQAGNPIRVLLDSEIADLEVHGLLPDVYTLDSNVMYQAVYDINGVLEYAVKYIDRALIDRYRDFIAMLFTRGEPISSFFQREIAPLSPPRPCRPAIPEDYLEQVGRPNPIQS